MIGRQHYYLVSGLPDIFFDDKKISVSLDGFRNYLQEYLTEQEMKLIRLHYWRFDNTNILNKLENNEEKHNTLGNLDTENLDELFSAIKDDSFESLSFEIPDYIIKFIEAYKAETPIYTDKSWELQFSELYFEYLTGIENKFISRWYQFEKNLGNILTAINCKKAGIPIDNQLIGSGDLVDKLLKSNARDFGVDNDDLVVADAVFKTMDTEDLMEQEKKLDTIRWDLLDESSFFHYFSLERLFVFLIKLSMVERWMSLDRTKGLELFKELLNSLETSYEFPVEFS